MAKIDQANTAIAVDARKNLSLLQKHIFLNWGEWGSNFELVVTHEKNLPKYIGGLENYTSPDVGTKSVAYHRFYCDEKEKKYYNVTSSPYSPMVRIFIEPF